MIQRQGYVADMNVQLDVTDDGFLSLMSDDGSTKDDVKVPDGEAGEKINKLFNEEGKDVNVIILTAMGEEACIDAKEVSNRKQIACVSTKLTFLAGSKGLND